ncbi:unnamed protein product, partial [Prorocentrum cordatum]
LEGGRRPRRRRASSGAGSPPPRRRARAAGAMADRPAFSFPARPKSRSLFYPSGPLTAKHIKKREFLISAAAGCRPRGATGGWPEALAVGRPRPRGAPRQVYDRSK